MDYNAETLAGQRHKNAFALATQMHYTDTAMRAKILFFILHILLLTPVFSAPVRGLSLSLALETLMKKKNFDTVTEPLSVTSQDQFPYNVLVYFPRNKEDDTSSEKKWTQAASDSQRNLLIYAVTQEDAYDHLDSLLTFLTQLDNSSRSCDCIVLFSAQEDSSVGLPLTLTGTESFARTFEDAERSAAVVIDFGQSSVTEIHIGNISRTAPLWLTRQLSAACTQTKTAYSYADKFASLYRLGLLPGNRRMNAFISSNIPAISIVFPLRPDLSSLSQLAVLYDSGQSATWDSHYLFFHILGRDFWIGESFFFGFSLILGTILLLLLCTSTFKGKNGEDYKKEFMRSWFFIPLTIAVTFLSLYLGQALCRHLPLLARSSPVVQFGIKLLFALFFNAIFFGIQEFLRFYSVQFIHGYFIYLIGISNVFIFSTLDLIFFLTFMIEYICIYVARKSVRIIPLILSVLLMLAPAIPYIYQLTRYARPQDLQQLVFGSPLLNLLLALLIFPFLIMWIRMIVRLQFSLIENRFSLKKLIVRESISTGIMVTLILISASALAMLSNQSRKRQTESKPEIINENRYSFHIDANKTEFLDMTTQHVTIASKEDVLKYEVAISSEDGIPLYDSTYDYTVNEELTTAFFTLPDYPPRTITIDYATDVKDAAKVFVTAWYGTDRDNVFRKESHGILVRGK